MDGIVKLAAETFSVDGWEINFIQNRVRVCVHVENTEIFKRAQRLRLRTRNWLVQDLNPGGVES